MGFDLNVSLHTDEVADTTGYSEAEQTSEQDGEEATTIPDLIRKFEETLEPGNIFESPEQVYDVFCEYGKCRGFSVRKGNQVYFAGTKEVRVKEFICSCGGHYEEKNGQHRLMKYKKQIYRSGCRVKLRIVREEGCPWKVRTFEKEHNHELVPPNESYLLRSARKLSHGKKALLEALNLSGIGVSRACRFMARESGGLQNIGITKKDAYNHMHSIRRTTKVENADADAVMKFFRRESKLDPFFYWSVQLDDDRRIMNFFFRDSRSLIDYEIFGDVLTVDTTHRTNRYDLVCVPFVGINHHMSNVMFGIAFLSDETTESFQWLFTEFLESLHDREPQIIFSDQCQALMNGIDSTFLTSRHRLCQWHINRNATARFGALNGNKAFKAQWHNCMNGVQSEEEFEECWSELIGTSPLEEKSWFDNMYKLRRRWASVFTNSYFSAGIHATSRSEVTNKVLKDLCSAKSSLMHFVECYEQIQTDWRVRESAADTTDIGMPGQYVNHNSLLMHAASVFTRKVYKVFEAEMANIVNVIILERPLLFGIDMQFKVSSQPHMKRIRAVQFHTESQIANCTCRMWEIEGVLCKHILRIYIDMNVFKLPDGCILHRWCKTAKRRHWDSMNRFHEQGSSNYIDTMAFVSYVMRMTYEVLNSSKDDKECRKIMLDATASLKKVISAILNAPHSKEPTGSQGDCDKSKSTPVCDPIPSKRTRNNMAASSRLCKRKHKKQKPPTDSNAKFPDVEHESVNDDSAGEHGNKYVDSPPEGRMYKKDESAWFSLEFFDFPVNLSQHSVHNYSSPPIGDNFTTPVQATGVVQSHACGGKFGLVATKYE